jgi:uncharacterized protein (TIGR00725 family)
MSRTLQIGVMGSCADLNYSAEIEAQAFEIGQCVARMGATLLFGAEKDTDSLSTAACRGAKSEGGLTIGVTYGKGKDVVEKEADVIISTGMERGGGREFVLVLSCDAIITIGGGSGTLTELLIAYQADIPMVALGGSGGWSDKVADTFLDERHRRKTVRARTPGEAVDLAYSLAMEARNSPRK